LKYLLILLVISILFILLYRRLRPYIAAAQQMLGIVRDVRRMNSQQQSAEPLRRASASGERLLRCASCDTWVPTARALKSSSGSSYCSRACLESATETVVRKRAGSR
jgi:hypothetical protein